MSVFCPCAWGFLGEGEATIVGNGTYWMTGAHSGHNAITDDDVTLVNGTTLGGHCHIRKGAILSGNTGIHQFCWIGEMAMSQGHAGASTHVPPYVIFAGINQVIALNSVGLRRAEHITDEDRKQIKEAFRMLYRAHLTPTQALEKMDECTDWGAPVDRFRQFVRDVLQAEPPFKRALCPMGKWSVRRA